jgi:hypothetical protein
VTSGAEVEVHAGMRHLFLDLLILMERGLTVRATAFRTPILGRSSVDQGSNLPILKLKPNASFRIFLKN